MPLSLVCGAECLTKRTTTHHVWHLEDTTVLEDI